MAQFLTLLVVVALATLASSYALKSPLYLTDYIENNRFREALVDSAVDSSTFLGLDSYSGLITVNKLEQANIFFWFFPSLNDPANDPVILWLQGDPGVTGLFSVFTENGPFEFVDGKLSLREYSWNKGYSVLYVDQPVGTGFSLTEGTYVENQTDVANHLYSFLTQFYSLYTDYVDKDLYIAGEYLGGKYASSLAYRIDQNNADATIQINLKGVIIGNGWVDPIHQLKYGDYLYQLGIVDTNAVVEYNNMEKTIEELIQKNRYEEATYYWKEMLSIYFYELTQLTDIYNFIKDVDDTSKEWESFITTEDIRDALHVGNLIYNSTSELVNDGLYGDSTLSAAPYLTSLLSKYRVLVYNGQLDILVGYVLSENYLQHLNFEGAETYRNADRAIWYLNGRVAGYVKKGGNLVEAMVRNAGQMVPTDQPAAAFDLIDKFIKDTL